MFGAKIDIPSVSVGGSCPFPLDPGEFWVTALKTIYGPSHVLIGVAPTPEFTTVSGDPLTTGPILTGLVFAFGAGLSDNSGVPDIQVKLMIQDVKMINADASIFIEYDHSRPGTDCSLVTLDPKRIFDKFVEFANPLNWPSLASELASNPIEFYSRNIEMFYPAGIDISFNVKAVIGGPLAAANAIFNNEDLVNLKPVVIQCGNTPQFPPINNIGLTPASTVELVKASNPAICMAKIEKCEQIFVHPFNGPEEKWCIAIAEGELTAQWIRDQVAKVFNVS